MDGEKENGLMVAWNEGCQSEQMSTDHGPDMGCQNEVKGDRKGRVVFSSRRPRMFSLSDGRNSLSVVGRWGKEKRKPSRQRHRERI